MKFDFWKSGKEEDRKMSETDDSILGNEMEAEREETGAEEETETGKVEEKEREAEEMEKMSGTNDKKKYMYLALDEEGKVFLDKDGEPVASNITEEGAAVQWPEVVKRYAEKIFSDPLKRVEVPDIDPTMRDRSEAKRKRRAEAKEKLFALSAEEIAEAKRKRMKSEDVIMDDHRELPKEDVSQKGDMLQDGGMTQKSDMLQEEEISQEKEENLMNFNYPESAVPAESMDTVTEIVSAVNQMRNEIIDNISAANGDILKSMRETEDELSSGVKKDINATAVDIKETMANMEKDLGSNVKKDITAAATDIKKTMADTEDRLGSCVERTAKAQVKNLEGIIKKQVEDSQKILSQKTQKAMEDISRTVNETGKNISNNISDSRAEVLSKVKAVGKRVDDFAQSVEGIEGKLKKLEQLDQIADLLQDKGLTISREIPPVKAEEEDIINLVRYSQKITEQLGYAARELIRKQESFRSQAESNENEQKIMAQRMEQARQEGVKEGKKQAVKQLLSKYEDIDAIKDSTESYIHVIWTTLLELGVVIDGDGSYEKGNEIELSDEDIEKMMATYSKFDGAGRYQVVKTGLWLNGEVISAAEFSKIDEGEETEELPQEQENETERFE